MESKYKERAKEILIAHYGCKDLDDLKQCFLSNNESLQMIIETMCQLAEEVEKECTLFVKFYHSELQKGNLYTKEQVEELLAKQRELCYENAKINWNENYIDLDIDDVFSFRDNDGNWCITSINGDSILNAKLNIE